jgi:hypothetical protein
MGQIGNRGLLVKIAIGLVAVLLASTCVYGVRRRSSRARS